MNNKTLGIAFVALLAIYLLIKMFSGNKERSFDPQIVSVDTAQVNRVEIQPAKGEAPFSVLRTGSNWSIERNGKRFEATKSSISSLLGNLVSINAERVVSKNPKRWGDYSVNDSLGTRIELFNDSKKVGDVVVGRFNFNQATRSGTSYIKRGDRDDVYSVDGFLSMSLSQGFDNFRDKTILSFNASDITKVSLQELSASRSYSLLNNQWSDQEGMQVDSAGMATYLNTLKSVSGQAFIEDAATQLGAKLKTLLVEGNNMSGPIEVNLYESKDTEKQFVIHSSSNQEGYFLCDSVGPFDRIFGKYGDPVSLD